MRDHVQVGHDLNRTEGQDEQVEVPNGSIIGLLLLNFDGGFRGWIDCDDERAVQHQDWIGPTENSEPKLVVPPPANCNPPLVKVGILVQLMLSIDALLASASFLVANLDDIGLRCDRHLLNFLQIIIIRFEFKFNGLG